MTVLSYSAAGLICDAAGAGILMRAFVFASDARVLSQAPGGARACADVTHEAFAQRIDARFGFPLLIAGFILQMAGVTASMDRVLVPALAIAAACVVLAYYGLMRDLHASQDAERATRFAARPTAMTSAEPESHAPTPPRLHLVEAASA